MDIQTSNPLELTTAATDLEVAALDWKYYLQLSGEILIAIASILTNGMVLVAIATTPKLQYITNYFVASLSTADLLVGLLGIPCVITAMHQKPNSFSGCLTVNLVIVILTQISIFSLLVIAAERFYAIKYPFEYNRIITPLRSGILIAITWAASITITLAPSFAWNLNKMANFKSECKFPDVIDLRFMVYFNFFGCVLPPLIIMTCLYFYIFRIVVKQRRIISATQLPPVGNTALTVTAAAAKLATHSKAKNYSEDSEAKIKYEAIVNGNEKTSSDQCMKKFPDSKENAIHEIENPIPASNGLGGIEKRENRKNKVSFALDVPVIDSEFEDYKVIENINFEEIDKKGEITQEDSNDEGVIETQNPRIKKKLNLFYIHGQRMMKKSGKMSKSISKKSDSMRKAGANLGKDIKAAKWFAVVLFCFCLCWLPLHTLNCLSVFNEIYNFTCLPFFVLLSHLNSAFNPILYALGNSKFAAAFRRILRLKPTTNPYEESHTSNIKVANTC